MLTGEKGSEGGVGATAVPLTVTRVLRLSACTSVPMRLLLRILQAEHTTKEHSTLRLQDSMEES